MCTVAFVYNLAIAALDIGFWTKYDLEKSRDEDPEFFSTDPDPAQLKKKFRIRIRSEIEMKKKIYLYFR